MLHADADLAVAVEGSVEAHDVGRVALVQHLQLPDDLVADGGLDLQVDQLQEGRGCSRGRGTWLAIATDPVLGICPRDGKPPTWICG